jgi:hypothetical protein
MIAVTGAQLDFARHLYSSMKGLGQRDFVYICDHLGLPSGIVRGYIAVAENITMEQVCLFPQFSFAHWMALAQVTKAMRDEVLQDPKAKDIDLDSLRKRLAALARQRGTSLA